MPTLLYRELGLVKGVAFNSWRRIGTAMQAIRVYGMREVDELVFLDISATKAGRPPDFELIDELADHCFMPLTVGGGVSTEADVGNLLRVGADKVAINSAAIEQPDLVSGSAARYGSQCIVVSIDAKREADGSYQVYTHSGTRPAGVTPLEAAQRAQAQGAGEIILTSIDRDGTMAGYDTELVRTVASAVRIPVVASGGCGAYEDMADVLAGGGASAVAASSLFHFTEATPAEAKVFLAGRGFPVRR